MAAAEAPVADAPEQQVAVPLHVQRAEQALQLEPLLNYVEDLLQKNSISQSDVETSTDADTDLDIDKASHVDADGNKIYNGIVTSRAERRADKTRLYNFTKVKKSRKWLKNLLLSDSSSDEDDDCPVTQDQLKDMLKRHNFQQKCRVQFYRDPEMQQYQYYSVGLLSNYDKFSEHQKMVIGPRKKISKEQKRMERKIKAKMKKMKEKIKQEKEAPEGRKNRLTEVTIQQPGKPPKVRKLTQEQIAAKRRKIWVALAKKEIPKAQKQKASARKEVMQQLKKVAKDCTKECRRAAMQSQRVMKECGTRARRLSREMLAYWKRFEKVEKEHRKRAEKEAQEQRKMDSELREMKRQQRKLNFLITQTELYAHFMARKLTGDPDGDGKEAILQRLEEQKNTKQKQVDGGLLTYTPDDDYDSDAMKSLALNNVETAFNTHQEKMKAYDSEVAVHSKGRVVSADTSLANPAMASMEEHPQPSIFQGKLKGYQLKGMNWLANLYHQGINGILADEMGLGKTVQSISLLAHLAESQGIWGPFLVIAPASTLHNWQQEVSRFLPAFKVVPYWGNTQDRKVLRKFWNPENLHTKDASFHVVITSYQLVIMDVKYFQRIKWQYMVLDEAQALKSTSSVRWKMLLTFNCRNRLLLSGTPIQNSMAELWALLHFIMPTLFDSHDEFNEWFSKDIENHAEKQSGIDENQLSRLHMILKPFMLRRVKKDVENELSDKIEILVYCPLTTRQKLLYQAVKNKISIEDLLQSSSNTSAAQSSTSSLMNLVMQFRKVCNHPELFERQEVRSPFQMKLDPYCIPKLIYRDGIVQTSLPDHHRLLYNLLNVFNPVHIHHSLFPKCCVKHKGADHVNSFFSFTRFVNMSPAELHNMMLAGLLVRWLAIFLWLKEAFTIHHHVTWSKDGIKTSFLDKHGFILEPTTCLSAPSVSKSPVLQDLIFTSPQSVVYAHCNHTLHYMPETVGHRKIRSRRLSGKTLSQPVPAPPSSKQNSPTKSPTKLPMSPTKLIAELPPHPHVPRPPKVLSCQLTEMPAFLYKPSPRAHSVPQEVFICDRSAAWDAMRASLCGTLEARQTLLYGTADIAEMVRYKKWYFFPEPAQGLLGLDPRHGYSGVNVPDKETLVTDAGKLYVLDTLLARLKSEGHRVLIYSQMTRMIDLLEEYMWHRKHTYMRLDGSSKISDRRDMVADFQSRTDIFVFLLSTRAGGLGINLTAADTVIFYDSDWNPTVDQQAMDRAHRLGQTKQVTVYRLICKGSIEERILQRAKEKSEIQKMVISGGNFRPDTLKPKEVVSLLLDDDEMEKKLMQKADEKKNKENSNKEKDRERKRKKYAAEKKGTGRGPGRPKKVKVEEMNRTIPATDSDSILSVSVDSFSAAASPMSVGSEAFPPGADDSSNEGLVIVDDAHSSFPPVNQTATPPPPKRGTGRPRGRPRGSGVGRRPRGRGSVRKAITAAEIAGAQAGKSAAFAAYGYSFQGTSPSRSSPTPPAIRGGHTSRGGGHSPSTPPRVSAGSTPKGSPHGFYSQRNMPS